MSSRCDICRREFESENSFLSHVGRMHGSSRNSRIPADYSYWAHFGQVLEEIRELAELCDKPTIRDFQILYGRREYAYLMNWFGSWSMACLVAGVRPARLFSSKVDAEWIASEIIEQDFDSEELAANTPLTKADVERVFGSWSDAVSFARELGGKNPEISISAT